MQLLFQVCIVHICIVIYTIIYLFKYFIIQTEICVCVYECGSVHQNEWWQTIIDIYCVTVKFIAKGGKKLCLRIFEYFVEFIYNCALDTIIKICIFHEFLPIVKIETLIILAPMEQIEMHFILLFYLNVK